MAMLVQRLMSTARAQPDAIAVVDGTRRVGYGELADGVRRFAGMLRAQGLGNGERVAIALPNREEAIVACYGAWLAGCIAVPLNVQASRRELGSWLRHCAPRVVLLEEDAAEAAAAVASDAAGACCLRLAPGTPGLDWTRQVDGAAPCADAANAGNGGHPAAILYTSGTTGAPKGVTLTHRNFVANVDAIVEYLELRADDSTVTILPFYYAYGASVLHTHLAAGARLVIEPNLVFPHVVVQALAREQATGFSGVPSTFALLLERRVLEGVALPRLRYVTQAGGAMTVAMVARLQAQLPQASLFVMYGQTEATARLAWLPPARLADKPGSAGRAISGVSLEVRDDAGVALAPGVDGEVWARGDNVMAGYWNDPAATALALRDGWLRTGDIGRLDDEGFLFLAGRRSDMIKTGAHRVHPLDVEEALLELDGVVDAAVAGVDDAILGQVVQAWVVARGDGLDVDAVRAHCRARLAAYKVPRHVVFVPALPRTASGKVRRALLAQPAALEEAT